MSYNAVEQLRKSGNLDEAYDMAVSDLKQAEEEGRLRTSEEEIREIVENEEVTQESLLVLGKRALAWVLYEFLKQNTSRENIDDFIGYLKEFRDIGLDEDEKMVVNQLVWLIGKSVFEYTKEPGFDIRKMEELADITMNLNFSRQSKGYSFMFKGFHKALKESLRYIDFAYWWDFRNFIRTDYKYTKQDDGVKLMAVAEQACNRYAKHLLNALNQNDADKEEILEKIREFMFIVDDILQHNKYYRKLPYYKVKLMMALGEYQKAFSLLKGYARAKQDEFWVWELMSEAYSEEPERRIACLSAALTCRAKPEKYIKVREKLAAHLIEESYFDEAKTEIGMILRTCLENKWDFPDRVSEWGEQPWYAIARVKNDNKGMYENFKKVAEDIIYGDMPERKVVVESVNVPKQILNFLGLDYSRGYFKFDKSLKRVREGDVLLVRIKEAGPEGRYNAYHVRRINENYVDGILKYFSGEVTIPAGKPFGFVTGMFLTPVICSRYNLSDGDYISGRAMISYNKKKEEWGWKVISVE